PPIELTNHVTISRTLTPQAPRDTHGYDLGYEYPHLDYLWSSLDLADATLTLTNGVAVGIGGVGINLRAGAKVVSEGVPGNLNEIVHYRNVQEQAVVIGGSNGVSFFNVPATYSPRPTLEFRFTDFAVMPPPQN